MFTPGDIFRFQIGDAGAIRRVLESRWSLLVGAIFVITAGIARHYDQKFLIREYSMVQPFAIVIVSSFAIFLTAWIALRIGSHPRDSRPSFFQQYLSFFGAFLMTTPLAWLYAIPVEQWFSLETAARINIGLLGCVSLWRVLLMTRVLVLVTRAHWLRCLAVVLLPASVEAMVLSEWMHLQLVGIMGGVQLPPDREILANALTVVSHSSIYIALAAALVIIWFRFGKTEGGFPGARRGLRRGTLVFSLAVLMVWCVAVTPSQIQQYHGYRVHEHMREENFREALDYVAKVGPLESTTPGTLANDLWDPYGAHYLAKMLKALDDSDPEWLRREYNRAALKTISMVLHEGRYPFPSDVLEGLISAPGGAAFIKAAPQPWLELLDEMIPWNGKWERDRYQSFRAALAAAGVDLSHYPLPPPEAP